MSARFFFDAIDAKSSEEGKSNVQLVWICFERCFSRNWMAIVSQDCGKFKFIELLCTRYVAFMGVLRQFNELVYILFKYQFNYKFYREKFKK